MKNILLILLLIVAAAMVFIGVTKLNPAPALTGVGFVLIAWMIYRIREF
jgi:hypothetical protein